MGRYQSPSTLLMPFPSGYYVASHNYLSLPIVRYDRLGIDPYGDHVLLLYGGGGQPIHQKRLVYNVNISMEDSDVTLIIQ